METMQHFSDGAIRLLQAALEHQDIADKAIRKMDSVVSNLERRNEELRRQIQQEVNTSLESSVGSAVSLLIEKFQEADKYAEQAAWRYEKAVRDFDRRRLVQVLITIIFSFLVGLGVGKFYL